MASVGKKEIKRRGHKLLNDPMLEYSQSYLNIYDDVLQETGMDIIRDSRRALGYEAVRESLKNWFIENSYDPNGMTTNMINEHIDNMETLFENSIEAMNEYAPVSAFNPIIGMSIPIHKNILMNNIYEQVIQKDVAVAPKFTISLEKRFLKTPQGEEIDIFKHQDRIYPEMKKVAPFVEAEVTLPELGTTDFVAKVGTTIDNLSIETYIGAVEVEITKNDDSKEYKWIPVRAMFTVGYGSHDARILHVPLSLTHEEHVDSSGAAREPIETILTGSMHKNKLIISCPDSKVRKVKVMCKKDTSNALTPTCTVSWGMDTMLEEIGPAIPIDFTLSPEEVKDIAALYKKDQLSQLMGIVNDVLANMKDDAINDELVQSFARTRKEEQFKLELDFAPRAGYALDHVEWLHKTQMFDIDRFVTDLLNVLNDPNMTVSFVGRPDIIRTIKPTEYTYATPQSIGPVELNFNRVVQTTDGRTYQFVSSQKRNKSDKIQVILKPNNSDRLIHRIYDYQFLVSNDIRNPQNFALTNVHAFERWKFVEFQPVQGEISVKNVKGYR